MKKQLAHNKEVQQLQSKLAQLKKENDTLTNKNQEQEQKMGGLRRQVQDKDSEIARLTK